MKRLAPVTTSRTILPLLVIHLMIAIAFLPAHIADAEASRTPKTRKGAHYQWRHHARHDSQRGERVRQGYQGKRVRQGYQGKRVRQGYQGKRVRQGYHGRRVPQGYQFEGNRRRYGDRLRLRPSSPPAKRSPYARRPSSIFKRSTPYAKTSEKSLWRTPAAGSSNPYGASGGGSYGNIFGVPPKKTRSRNSSHMPLTSYGSNPYGMSNDDTQKDSSGTSPETPALPSYSLIAPGWSGNN